MKQPIQNMIGAGQITSIDDTGGVQTMQVSEVPQGSGFMTRVLDKVQRIFQFGFTSVPPLNSQVLTLNRNGDRTLSIAIGTSHPASRPTGLQPGDSAQYDVRGLMITLTAAGVTIQCQGLPLVVENTSGMHVQGPLTVDDDITALAASDALTMSAIRSFANGHKHAGVTTGTGNSGDATTTL